MAAPSGPIDRSILLTGCFRSANSSLQASRYSWAAGGAALPMSRKDARGPVAREFAAMKKKFETEETDLKEKLDKAERPDDRKRSPSR